MEPYIWFTTLITNCSNNYGPWQYPEKLIPVVILKAILGDNILIYGKGLNIRDWLFVDDHIDAINLVVQNRNPVKTIALRWIRKNKYPISNQNLRFIR